MTTYMKFLILLVAATHAERTWLWKLPHFPDAEELKVVHYFSVDATKKPSFELIGPARVEPAPGHEGYELVIISSKGLTEVRRTLRFCENGKANLPDDSYQWQVGKDGVVNSQPYKTPADGRLATGIWYVGLTNCKGGPGKDGVHSASETATGLVTEQTGSASSNAVTDAITKKTLPQQLAGMKWFFVSGELSHYSSVYGYLPAEDRPKLTFYWCLAVAYGILLFMWFAWCSAWRDVLFKIHHYITAVIVVGGVEAACWYISLLHWNTIGHRWWSMIVLATCGTILKEGVSFALLYAACAGAGVTKPRLSSKDFCLCFCLVICFLIGEILRHSYVLVKDVIGSQMNTGTLTMLVYPGAIISSIMGVWIVSTLQKTIQELRAKHQTVKLVIYEKLRLAMVVIFVMGALLLLYEITILRPKNIASHWQEKYIFTDVLSHACFFMLLTVIMVLWRPSEQSLNLAWSDQIACDDVDPGTIPAVDIELGEEIEHDFRDSPRSPVAYGQSQYTLEEQIALENVLGAASKTQKETQKEGIKALPTLE